MRIYESYTKEWVRECETQSEVMKFIAGEATELNYGIFRKWQIDDTVYNDCGPVTYIYSASEFEKLPE